MIGAFINAPALRFLSDSTSPKKRGYAMSSSAAVRIAVVGDVHDDWDLQEDTNALQLLQPDLVLFTGDFGNENVELVQSVADLEFPKAVILGNHDSWKTQQFSGKRKDGVQLQLECLGEEYVPYRRLDFPTISALLVDDHFHVEESRSFGINGALWQLFTFTAFILLTSFLSLIIKFSCIHTESKKKTFSLPGSPVLFPIAFGKVVCFIYYLLWTNRLSCASYFLLCSCNFVLFS